MKKRSTIQALYIFICMCVLGFLIGYEYRILVLQGQASIGQWLFGILAVLGWIDILWKAAFRIFRFSKHARTKARR